MRKRRTFTAEFKREAVRQLELGEKTPTELARSLGVARNKLYRWQEEIDQQGDTAFSRSGGVDLAEENARLKKELAAAREEAEILKKAAAFFARDLK